MQPLKILNIAILALIITLILQMFMPKPTANVVANDISFLATEKSVTLPNIPKLSVHNATNSPFLYNACQDISLKINSQPINIAEFYKKNNTPCENIAVEAGKVSVVNLNPLHKLFSSQTAVGDNIFALKTPNGEKLQTVSVSAPGFVRSFLSALIFEPIYNLFVAIITVLPGHELGWAIIVVTIIIRLILLIPQHKMLENTRRLAELSPKIRALQKEYESDRATLGMKMMELYKKEGVNPMGSCLPLLIQIPILLGLYWVISGISDPSNFYHLYPFFKDFNISAIDTNFFGIDLLKIGGTFGMVMALLLAFTQWIQSYLALKAQSPLPKKEEKNTENKEISPLDPRIMQKMSLYVFPILIGITGFMFPLGLGLYWWIGLLFMIVQQYYVNTRAKHKAKK